jgi:hypothetical protein
MFGDVSTSSPHCSLVRHLSYVTDNSVPYSTRNRLIYFLAVGNVRQARTCVKTLFDDVDSSVSSMLSAIPESTSANDDCVGLQRNEHVRLLLSQVMTSSCQHAWRLMLSIQIINIITFMLNSNDE